MGGVIASMLSLGYSSTDVFAFSGAVVGAAATVAGTAWLNDRSRRIEFDEERRLIEEEIGILCTTASALVEHVPSHGLLWSDKWTSGLNALSDITRGSQRFLAEVIEHAKTLNFVEREAIRSLAKAVNYFVLFNDNAFGGPDELDPMDERTWAGVLEVLMAACAEARLTFRPR